jgi:negative regulator of sigma E activity
MTHLTPEQLSAFMDGGLPARENAAAAAHVESCEACRAALASLRADDAALAGALTDDPGDAYFATFAARVAERVAAEGARAAVAPQTGSAGAGGGGFVADVSRASAARPKRETSPWYDIGSWFRTPTRLAWVGGVATLIVAAGVVLMTVRESGVPELRDAKLLERGSQGAARAPAPMDAPGAGAESSGPGTQGSATGDEESRLNDADARSPESNEAARGALPSRAREMKRLPGGEDVPVGPDRVPGFAQPPATPTAPPAEPGQTTHVTRQRRAVPLAAGEQERAGQAKADTKDETGASGAPVPEAQPAPPPTAARSIEKAKPAAESLSGTTDRLQSAPSGVRGGRSDELKTTIDSRLCGSVVDARGAPVAGAQVVISDHGVTAITDASGHYCLDAAPGTHPLSVFAVGFTPLRKDVSFTPGAAVEPLVVRSVEVLPGTMGATRALLRDETVTTTPGVPDSMRAVWSAAERATAEAQREGTAARFDVAGVAWNDVVARMPRGDAEIEARFRLADVRYRAWELEPTPGRAAEARRTLREFIDRAPAGPRQDRARTMLARVGA